MSNSGWRSAHSRSMDHSGSTEVHSVNAWIQKLPKIERAKEAGTIVWMFACADLEIHAGGNVF